MQPCRDLRAELERQRNNGEIRRHLFGAIGGEEGDKLCISKVVIA